jgi:hypothetical protein
MKPGLKLRTIRIFSNYANLATKVGNFLVPALAPAFDLLNVPSSSPAMELNIQNIILD